LSGVHDQLAEGTVIPRRHRYAAQREGGLATPSLLLCHRSDAQLTEQQYRAQRFCELCVDADVVHPDELAGDKVVEAWARSGTWSTGTSSCAEALWP
jgi:hypothetical protein